MPSRPFNPDEALRDPALRNQALAILQAVIQAQQASFGANAPINGASAIQAMTFLISMLIEANPHCQDQTSLQQVVAAQNAEMEDMTRLLRIYYEQSSEHMLEKLGRLSHTIN